MAEEIEMKQGFIVALTDIEATVLRQSSNGDYCFTVDIEDKSEPHGHMRLWVSDDLDQKLIEKIRDQSHIRFSAQRDDDGDMIVTNLKVLN